MQAQRLSITQQQRLTLTPHLVQSIKLLAMPMAELQEHIIEQLEKNPALELITAPKRNTIKYTSPKSFTNSNTNTADDHQAFLENISAPSPSLKETLLSQLLEIHISPTLAHICERIIQNLDENGFHLTPLEQLFSNMPQDLNDKKNIEIALHIVQNLEPIGTACADFKESLIVQAYIREDAPELARTILEHNFSILEKVKPTAIAKYYKVSIVEATEILDFIKSLEPFPGRLCSSERITYIIPDVIIKKNNEGFIAFMNEDEIPLLQISPIFKKVERDKTQSIQTQNFVNQQIREARWFMGTITQRNHSLLKVVRMIVLLQSSFFENGPAHLAPLRLQDVAQEIGMHEATVSRISNGKYLQCEWGVFEIKYFFSSRVHTSGKNLSKGAVKLLLKELIEKNSSLSDQKLSDILVERGIFIARRTVAKYRKELIIKSSFERT